MKIFISRDIFHHLNGFRSLADRCSALFLGTFALSILWTMESQAAPFEKIYLDTLSLKYGAHQNSYDTNELNGGVANLPEPSDSGDAYAIAAVFNNEYLPALKPYFEYSHISADERDITLYSLGLRHERMMNSADTWQWFASMGAGQSYLNWELDTLASGVSGVSGAKSSVGTIQTGLDWFVSESWGVGLTLRADFYDLDTAVVQGGGVTTFVDSQAVSALLGLSYRFGQRSQRDQADDDGDGVPNYLDSCPHTLKNIPVQGNGCPQDTFLFNLSFEFGEFKLVNLSTEPTFNVVHFLAKHPNYVVHINGYADSIGSVDFNQELSLKRARSAADYLVEQDISPLRISWDAKGQNYPLTSNDSEANREKNRRIEVIFYKTNKSSLTQKVNAQ